MLFGNPPDQMLAEKQCDCEHTFISEIRKEDIAGAGEAPCIVRFRIQFCEKCKRVRKRIPLVH
ncbi:hypothetical protein JW752_02325 [Candidatus Peregrinibacteria bacterium]|nr:hypothetical protein [Candidatus Peregrinibacteria bacterium]